MLNSFLKDESGQGLAEYALILALIAIVVIAAMKLLGTAVDSKLDVISNELNAAGSTT